LAKVLVSDFTSANAISSSLLAGRYQKTQPYLLFRKIDIRPAKMTVLVFCKTTFSKRGQKSQIELTDDTKRRKNVISFSVY